MMFKIQTPEEIAQGVLTALDLGNDTEGEPKSESELTDAFQSGWLDGSDIERLIIAGINADRAQW